MSPAPQSPTAPTTPVFVLGSALRWLGHDWPDRRCSQSIDALTASVWFIRRRGQHFPKYPSETLLVVDLIETGEPLARIHWMIDEVNRCTRGDAIRARQRRSSDNGHDLIALTCTSDAGSRLTDPLATVETTSLIARAGRCAGQRPTADSAATTASLPGSTRGLIA
jgi:hypothetical protein